MVVIDNGILAQACSLELYICIKDQGIFLLKNQQEENREHWSFVFVQASAKLPRLSRNIKL